MCGCDWNYTCSICADTSQDWRYHAWVSRTLAEQQDADRQAREDTDGGEEG